MIRWILGTAGTGKTSRVLEEAGKAARAGQRVLLLVPEQYSLEMEKSVRHALDASSALRVEVYSFTRLCDRIFRELGGAAPTDATGGGPIFNDASGAGTA